MTKRKQDAHSIKDLMGEVFRENKLEKGMLQISVREAWEKLMGPGVNSYTEKVTLKGGELVVKLRSSVLREELSYGKEKIMAMMNKELGSDVVNRIILA
jgi:hypothetical protein